MSQTQSIKLLHYRNGTYQGQVKAGKRQGKGILIADSGEILIGQWKNDKLHGNAVLIFNSASGGEYAYGQFNRGELEGWFKFQSNEKILIAEFNSDRPINKQLFVRKDHNTAKIIIPKYPIFEIVKQIQLEENYSLSTLIAQQLESKINCTSLATFFKKTFEGTDLLQIETLPNGYSILKFNDKSNPLSLGLIINKNEQLISFGTYAISNKLSGYGCKYENSPLTRYEGMFQNGFLNGEGLKFNTGKYSFGMFENGTLVDPTYLEERSLASEEKLKELKKLQHIKNINFTNCYLNPRLVKFRGTRQIVFEVSSRQDFSSSTFYNTAQEKSGSKQSNNLASKLMTSSKDPYSLPDMDTKSNYSMRQKHKQNLDDDMERPISRISEGKGMNPINSLKKFQF